MNIKTLRENETEIAILSSDEVLIKDVQSALDLIASVTYETGCWNMVIDKSSICEDFFNLRTKIAGDVLQKFINYQVRVAIVGDFSIYDSKSLRDFITESNRGRDIFFVADTDEAIRRLGKSK